MNKWKDFDAFYTDLLSEVYHEPDSVLTSQVTDAMLPGFLQLLRTNMRILDLGCGAGYAMRKMRELGFTNVEGLTLDKEDVEKCEADGFKVHKLDFNFTGFNEEFDAVWMRHVLEHSPFPFYTIYQLNKMLKVGGWLYVEMPQPSIERLKNSERGLEHWKNHYSIMGAPMYKSLFQRAGFELKGYDEIVLKDLKQGNKTFTETYDWYVLQKQKNITLKS